MIKFLFVGSAAYSNRGCEAIVRGTIEILSQQFPESRFIISSTPEEDIIDGKTEVDKRIERMPPHQNDWVESQKKYLDPKWWTYRVALRPFPQFFNAHLHSVQLSAMKQAECALQVGGDNYTFDYGAPQWLVRLDQALLSTKKPLILWGASIGPFSKDSRIESMMKDHLKKFTLICARETETLQYLHSLGVRDNVKFVADPAFLMKPEKPILSPELMDCINKRPIGINMSAFSGKFTNASSDKWFINCRSCIQAVLSKYKLPVLLVPHVFKETNDDHVFLERIAQVFPEWGKRLFIVPRTLSAAQLKWVISQTRIFVGARTHSTIAALSTCIPTISIGYSVKARGINKDIFDTLNWMIPVDKVCAETLIGKIDESIKQEDNIRAHLSGRLPSIIERSRSAGKYVAELLRTNS